MAALRASYHRILDKVEHMLPAKLRPFYNHPAGNLSSITFSVLTSITGCQSAEALPWMHTGTAALFGRDHTVINCHKYSRKALIYWDDWQLALQSAK